MERIFEKGLDLSKTVVPALIIMGMISAMVVIAYGADSVASGVHDAFHDFRHVIGMACH